jgi:hypothetical protein
MIILKTKLYTSRVSKEIKNRDLLNQFNKLSRKAKRKFRSFEKYKTETRQKKKISTTLQPSIRVGNNSANIHDKINLKVQNGPQKYYELMKNNKGPKNLGIFD